MKDEWWLRAAISDDKLVAELLLQLKDFISNDIDKPTPTPSPSPLCFSHLNPLLPPSWGVRQPRSRLPTSVSSSMSAPEKKRETRRSPTTPLSWTDGASPSDGCEESSSLNNNNNNNYSMSQLHPPPSNRFRSKNSAASDTPATSSKRPRRKKTFAELKEEESTLMKERSYLKKELATIRLTLMEQRSINENLKRIKLDRQVEFGVKVEANSVDHDGHHLTLKGISEASSSSACKQFKSEDAAEPSCPAQKGFVLPDLNMAPEEDCGAVGMS